MTLREAKQLKVGDTLYHYSLHSGGLGKRATTVVKGEVMVEPGSPPKWGILVQDDDSTEIRMLMGKYAFNWSVKPL